MRKKGGFEGKNGKVYDNTDKVQHHQKPMGHAEVLSKASSDARKQASPPPMGEIHSNIGKGMAMKKAVKMGGGMSAGYGDDPIYESKERIEAGKMASRKAMDGKRGGLPGIGEKASGYRKVSEAMAAPKAKRQKGS